MTHDKEHDDSKVCIDCGDVIEYLADFPGPRCLKCHAAKMDKLPLERPDFVGALNLTRRRRAK